MENQSIELTEEEKTALTVQSEFEALESTGKTTFNFTEIEPIAPTIYNLIFDSHEVGSENGIETETYSLIEIKDDIENFKFTKK